MYCKIRYCGPPPGNPGGREGEGRGGFDLVSCSREREMKKGKMREGGEEDIVRFDKNIKDQRDPAHRDRISRRRRRDVSDLYIIENQTGRRDVIFKSSREIAI